MIFQTQLKHCFTKYECQLQGRVAWIQVSTWLALHQTDWELRSLPSSFICWEGLHQDLPRKQGQRLWKPMGPHPVPDLTSRAESNQSNQSVLLFVKVEQDILLPCSTEEKVEEADQQPPFPCYFEQNPWSRSPGTWASATRAGTVPHAPATSLRQRSI